MAACERDRRACRCRKLPEGESEELPGSKLTITSLGPLGGIATTPVINRPEVAIIGPSKVVERPLFRDGQLVVTNLMNPSISCNHRVVDGWNAASFVQAIEGLIETPSRLSALLSRAEVAISSAWVALSRSGPRNRAMRRKLPSLLRMMPGAIIAAQGRKSESREARRACSRRNIMGF